MNSSLTPKPTWRVLPRFHDFVRIFIAPLQLERVLINFPKLKICVPHLGFDEISAYRKLIEKYDNLWLDTTMVLTDYFPLKETLKLDSFRVDRIMYGSDFPNIPYGWDRELKWLKTSGLPHDILEWVLMKSATHFFGLD